MVKPETFEKEVVQILLAELNGSSDEEFLKYYLSACTTTGRKITEAAKNLGLFDAIDPHQWENNRCTVCGQTRSWNLDQRTLPDGTEERREYFTYPSRSPVELRPGVTVMATSNTDKIPPCKPNR